MSNKSKETIEQELAAYKKLGSLDQRDLVATSDLSNTFSAIRDDLSSKLDIVGKDCYVESIDNGTIAQGSQTSAFGEYSLALGQQSLVSGNYSHAEGDQAYVYANKAFGWSGDGKYEVSGSTRDGTFNINPANGISGLYIGDKSLASYIDGISSSIIGDYATKKEVNAVGTTLNMVSSDYVKSTTFSALSNTIGLSAASASNQVVTKKDIADLAGAMHFRGAVSDPSEITDPEAGDIVIIKTNSKEYVYNGEDWIELGDEAIYATKAEVSAYALKTEAASMSAYAYGQASSYTDAEIAKLSVDRFALSANVDSLVAEVSAATLDEANGYTDTAITNLSNSNIYINSISSDEAGNVGLDVAEKLDKFTIYKFDSLSAYNLSGSSFGILSSDIVLIDEENINAEGHRILSVASPELSDDAATKGYVDANDSNLSIAIGNKIFIDGVSAESLCAIHISQQDYYDLVSSNSTSSNVLYIVSSDNINAYGQKIENLAEPELSTDAATKGYVDNANANLKAKISGSAAINTLVNQVNIGDGISNVEIETAISALLDLVNILSGNA